MSNLHSGRISDPMYPFYRVFDEKGEQYCDCSHEQYAIRTVELHAEYQNEKFTYRKINAPKPLPPHIVDVSAECMKVSYQVKEDYLNQKKDFLSNLKWRNYLKAIHTKFNYVWRLRNTH